jgi:hypothetical protein
MTEPAATPWLRHLLTAAGTTGLVVIVIGTFLPWLGSGTAQRNSYAAGGAVRRLLTLDRPLHDLLAGWPVLGLLAAVAIAAALMGHPLYGLGLGMVVALIAGGSAGAVLGVHGNRYAHVLHEGPIWTLAGAMLVALTGLITVGLAFTRRPQ